MQRRRQRILDLQSKRQKLNTTGSDSHASTGTCTPTGARPPAIPQALNDSPARNQASNPAIDVENGLQSADGAASKSNHGGIRGKENLTIRVDDGRRLSDVEKAEATVAVVIFFFVALSALRPNHRDVFVVVVAV